MRRRTLMIVFRCVLALQPASLAAQTQLAMLASADEKSAVTGTETPEISGTATLNPAAHAEAPPGAPTVVRSTVEVHADNSMELEAVTPMAVISQKEMQSAAGTFGDFSRYLQVLPGVTWNSDLSNEVLVRGGHPTENLFVVDGIEVPNINHFALSGSNGGFTSMLDTAVIGSVEMNAGTYDAAYSSRLSSLIEIHTKELNEATHAGEISVGIAGAGGFYSHPLTSKGSILVSAHRSIINLITNDVGINGVPTYTNGLMRVEWNPSNRDHLSLLALGGNDSIDVTPCPSDSRVTSEIQMQYSGWRATEGVSWDHTFSSNTTSKLSFSHSTMSQSIGQQQQNGYLNSNGLKTCTPASLTPVYTQNSNDGLTALNYEVRTQTHGWIVSVGASEQLVRPDDAVAQPVGQLSPFSASTTNSDSVNIHRNFTSGETAGFIEAEGGIGTRWKAMVGVRAESFAVDDAFAIDPRASISYLLNGHQSIHAAASMSSQLPPLMDMLTYTQNSSLRPTTVVQESIGMRVWQGNWGTLDVDTYQKNYHNEPVSTEYPQLMLANMIDTIGQQFVWLPLKSAGTVESRGIALALHAHLGSRLQLFTSATYSRTTTRALDGIRRPGNYDIPFVLNVMANVRLPWKVELNIRESLSSGRPYTPFNLTESNAQSRGIYDLTEVNGARGSVYNRLDMQVERNFKIHKGILDLQIGAENVLNRSNFLGYTWLNNCQVGAYCAQGGEPMAEITQMGLYPVASARYQF